jgi:hypothetical protein
LLFVWRLLHTLVPWGRTNLHGYACIECSLPTWAGKKDWASDPELADAHLVIAGVHWVLASPLRLASRFEFIYEDAVASVFISHPRSEA